MKHSRYEIERWRLASLKSQAGNAIVEFALLLMLMGLLVVGTIDFGRVFYAGITVASAARAGAQYGAQDTSKSLDVAGMQQAALNDAQNLSGATATATRYCECTDGTSVACNSQAQYPCADHLAPRMYVRVTVTKTFTTLFHYPQVPTSVALSKTAVMRVQ